MANAVLFLLLFDIAHVLEKISLLSFEDHSSSRRVDQCCTNHSLDNHFTFAGVAMGAGKDDGWLWLPS